MDIVINAKIDMIEEGIQKYLDNVHELCHQTDFKNLPDPLKLTKEPTVPYTMQLFIVRSDVLREFHIVKQINLEDQVGCKFMSVFLEGCVSDDELWWPNPQW